jgi:nicotinamidase/pyrazinamidase
MVVRVLDIVDMQFDFVDPKGILSVAGAESLVDRAHKYFASISGKFDFCIVKYDTHFPSEYPLSPESVPFPNIHCTYGTKGWDLAVDLSFLPKDLPVFYMAKNTFDMWQENPISDRQSLSFSNADEEAAYDNLFKVSADPFCRTSGIERDAFFAKYGNFENFEVTMIGVASDFCVHDAALGYLNRGSKVNILDDLVVGIGTEVPGRARSGKMEDVLQLPDFKDFYADKKARLI